MELVSVDETQDTDENTTDGLDEETSIDEEKRIVFYVQRLKLAVAIAVIQSCPADMSPETYASCLVQSCIDDNNKLKIKCEALERDILFLEQKVQIAEMKDKLNICDASVSLLNTDDTPYSRALQPYSMLPLNLQTRMSNTMEFVRGYILLCSVANIDFEQYKQKEKYQETVIRSISVLFEYLRSHEGLSVEFEITKCAVKEICRLIDSKANDFETNLVKLCMNFVEELLLDIYHTIQINMVEYQHRRSILIQMLAEQKKLTGLILSRLLREITIISDSFITCLESNIDEFTPLLKMENTYFILQTAEGILHIMRQQKSALNALKIPKALVKEWKKTTEKALLKLSSHFSLYCIYVWHLKTLLATVLELDHEI